MTIYPNIRRAQTRQEIDRRTWADLSRIGFPVKVNGAGEYLTPEPIMFGRAYEEPPFFTFSVVLEDPMLSEEVRAIGWPPPTFYEETQF